MSVHQKKLCELLQREQRPFAPHFLHWSLKSFQPFGSHAGGNGKACKTASFLMVMGEYLCRQMLKLYQQKRKQCTYQNIQFKWRLFKEREIETGTRLLEIEMMLPLENLCGSVWCFSVQLTKWSRNYCKDNKYWRKTTVASFSKTLGETVTIFLDNSSCLLGLLRCHDHHVWTFDGLLKGHSSHSMTKHNDRVWKHGYSARWALIREGHFLAAVWGLNCVRHREIDPASTSVTFKTWKQINSGSLAVLKPADTHIWNGQCQRNNLK